MGLFGWHNPKKEGCATDVTNLLDANNSFSSQSNISATMKVPKKRGNLKSPHSVPGEPSMKHLPDLILDLKTAVDTAHERSVGALRKLFALSEHAESNNRIEMVHAEDGALVPTLLYFLERCARKSPEQFLSLLVLNNMSIPTENKRLIALDCDGARILSHMLCDDPSCHLLAIVLVNLTFSDAELRKELVSDISGIGIAESLAFALRISSLAKQEYEARQDFIEDLTARDDMSPVEKLSMLMAEDHRLRPDERSSSFQSGKSLIKKECIKDMSQQCFPETARWCLAAVKNLTRPCKDAAAAHVLIKSGILSLILHYVIIPKEILGGNPKLNDSIAYGSSPSSSSDNTPMADPLDTSLDTSIDIYDNAPPDWDSNSVQDAALHIILNLAACPVSRDYVFEADAVTVLSAIAKFSTLGRDNETNAQISQKEYQCLKARMALAFLLGSQGHFGQSKITSKTSTVLANPADSPLVLNEADIELLMELLLNTLEQKGKEGPGGYSATTFDIKFVLFSLRCLLTHTANQTRITALAGRKLNTMLLKVLAQFAMRNVAWMNIEAAEHAVFCLYLTSNYGFGEQAFLPESFSNPKHDAEQLAAKVLTSYLCSQTPTPAGRHAAEQLLLRLSYLSFDGHLSEVVGVASAPLFVFDEDLMSHANAITLGKAVRGAKPSADIFDRPIMRSRKPKKGTNALAPWDNMASVSVFANALQAVQQLSYGSIKVRHAGLIDDIMIANNIVSSACGEKTESYNFLWIWEDKASEISKNLGRQRSPRSNGSLFRDVSARLNRTSDGLSSFSFSCGSLCSADTTI